MKNLTRAKAIHTLMPKGGYSVSEGVIQIHPDGISYGYSVPTLAEINIQIAKIEANAPIIAKLVELDKVISRAKEDKANNLGASLDAVDQAVVSEKSILRLQLK